MKLRFLGTGTSNGVPVIGCQCKVCRSKNPKDFRYRTAAMVETERTRVLIDCGPDIRMQLMPLPFRKIDAVLLRMSTTITLPDLTTYVLSAARLAM